MLNVGPGELIAISMVALIVLGPQRLPGALRQVGKFVGELRKMSTGFQDELRNAFDDAEIEQARRTMEASTPESSPAAAKAKPIDATGVESTSAIDDDDDDDRGPEPPAGDDVADVVGDDEPEAPTSVEPVEPVDPIDVVGAEHEPDVELPVTDSAAGDDDPGSEPPTPPGDQPGRDAS